MSKTIIIKVPKVKMPNLVLRDMTLAGKGKFSITKVRHRADRRPKDARRIREEMEID